MWVVLAFIVGLIVGTVLGVYLANQAILQLFRR